MTHCPCGQAIQAFALHCPRCGQRARHATQLKKHLKSVLIVLAIVGAFFLGMLARGPMDRAGLIPNKIMGGIRASASPDNWRSLKDKMTQGHALTPEEVTLALGAPDEITGTVWWYRPKHSTGSVTFRGGRVLELSQPDDLEVVK